MKTRIGERWHVFWKGLRRRNVAGVVVGRRDARPDDPAHTPGVSQGNWPGRHRRQRGLHPRAVGTTATASRSTGINPLARNSLVPGAPRLTPP